ncbi:Nif3-like dinuclear metal center hexameric protein [Paenibacillus hunanensis]|uniref:GTP cyclohydrolase 1 type 2 homolog n=1 Tax=Paenibacillus hunanensis TaxID=539262 RepID=A0ABU1J3C7_9BACL|nr:Nif3-like dinuclear metal center hexameric protein [Paenibacillus hunanensis]MDR6245765.1 dinuclear metal center YbgI/SA1388 family protein [Paenibacillus hunanensis]WPP42814.1 Nif3-like dinuclear metal center hexameric protein [Paenibacillus hunanensis]GGJ19486.1 GTP cyclohydrolase 1 type 2 [Paenibacillus hunanensis]
MLAKGQTVIQYMEQFAPKSIAVPDDRIGLQLGSLQKEITGVLVALDVTDAVVDEAIAKGANLIIAHHAIIFRPLKSLQTSTPMGKLYEKLIKHDIAVYISHTNLDIAEGGVNDWMADALGLRQTVPIEQTSSDDYLKLVTFVPQSHLDAVRSAVWATGAGHIGAYSHCGFTTAGTGTFLPEEGTQPFSGEQGRLEHASEVRFETIIPSSLKNKAVQALIKSHPYEEVAYDLYPLALPGKAYGLGRVGKLDEPVTLAEFVNTVKQGLDVKTVRVVGDLERTVKKAAVLGGSGSRYVNGALFKGADVIVTGDIDYHTAHDALMAGIAIIDPGHNTEKIMKPGVAGVLRARLEADKYDTPVYASEIDTEVFRFV